MSLKMLASNILNFRKTIIPTEWSQNGHKRLSHLITMKLFPLIYEVFQDHGKMLAMSASQIANNIKQIYDLKVIKWGVIGFEWLWRTKKPIKNVSTIDNLMRHIDL